MRTIYKDRELRRIYPLLIKISEALQGYGDKEWNAAITEAAAMAYRGIKLDTEAFKLKGSILVLRREVK